MRHDAIPTDVSIVIPTFNRAEMLRRCIASALAQTVRCEVVVCDHGSQDETPQIAASFGDRIRYIRREQDSGVHFAWLDAVISASGSLVHINYDDDYIAPTFVEECLKLITPEVGLVFSLARVRDESTGSTVMDCFTGFGKTGVYSSRRFMALQFHSLVSPGATLMRREDIIDQLLVGGIPFARREYRGVGPDWLITAMTCLKYPKVGHVAEPLAIFSANDSSITYIAERDPDRRVALHGAYQEARRYYVVTCIVRVLRIDRVASVLSEAFRVWGRVYYRLMRVAYRKDA
ncbi:MAG: glycosyltransferase family 2 protein [Caldilineae bacterium]|nr:glycosyltransferase family 2 protein [Caldilineae bacterium]